MSYDTVYPEKLLAEYIKPHEYGTVIRHQEIEEITGVKYKTHQFYSVVDKTKKLLEPVGKAIAPVGGGDYKILLPGDYSPRYGKYVDSARKRIKRGTKLLKGAPTKDMTQDELTTYNRVSDFNAKLCASFSGSVVEVKMLISPPHPFENALGNGTEKRK